MITFNGVWGHFRNIVILYTNSPVGSAIYVFFFTTPQWETHLNITLDEKPAGTFHFVPGPTESYHYNVSVYSNSTLFSGMHSIVISTAGAASAILEFDYAVYSFVYHILKTAFQFLIFIVIAFQIALNHCHKQIAPDLLHKIQTTTIARALIS